MNFDDYLKLINDWGKFQKIKYLIICLSYMLPSIMVYTYSFTAAIPNFRCEFNEEYQVTKEECSIYQKSISLKECQRCFIRSLNNQSIESCHSYVFDKKYYQSTLTEEVKKRFLFKNK
jgi:hypothetical protein